MKTRHLINKDYDKQLYENEEFIIACVNFIENGVDNLNSFKYYEQEFSQKKADALYYIQISGKHQNLFNNIAFLKENIDFLDWNLISCDNRITWNKEKLNIFKDKLTFGTVFQEYIYHSEFDFIQRCTRQIPTASGVSLSNSLSPELITTFFEIWDWEKLANNPKIFDCDIYDTRFFKLLIKEISFSANPAWTIENLQKIKSIYNRLEYPNKIDINSFYGKTKYRNDNIFWAFSWQDTFQYAKIDWNLTKINQFIDVIDNHDNQYSKSQFFSNYCWNGISYNIKDKETILTYQDKLNFRNLSQQKEIVWDTELFEALIGNLFEKEYQEMDGYYGSRNNGLPYIIENIKITEEAIIKHVTFWNKTYYYGSYRRTSDGNEKILDDYTFLHNLEKNKNLNLTDKINEYSIFNNLQRQ